MGKFRDMSQGSGSSTAAPPRAVGSDAAKSVARRRRTADGLAVNYRRSGRATQWGENALASGDFSAAFGPYAYASEDGSGAYGPYARAEGKESVAVGSRSDVRGRANSLAGSGSVIDGHGNALVGQNSRIVHDDCVVIGNGLATTEDGQILIGDRFVVNADGDIVIDGVNVSEQLVQLDSLPFSGILGSGRDEALTISANTTATKEIPIYQFTEFTVESGDTWTAYDSKPGGFIISVKGTCTIAGTIDASSRGGRGADAQAAGGGALYGKNGFAGFNFGGTGGAGGGDGADNGGHGAPCRGGSPLGGWQIGNVVNATGISGWSGSTVTGASQSDIRSASDQYVTAGGVGTALTGGAGNSFAAGQAPANMPDLFNVTWSLFRSQCLGWGSGGGSGATDGGAASGAGGHGGGTVIILCEALNFTGTINANGGAGGNGAGAAGGGGGGGGGGSVLIGYRTLISNAGTINVNGGAAGTGAGGASNGGAGGAGFYKVFAMQI